MRRAIDGFLVPAFGPLRLEQLTPQAIQRWLTDHKVKHGGRRQIALAHATLRSALTDAQRLQLVCDQHGLGFVKVPRPVTKAIAPLDLEQSRAFLVAAGRRRLRARCSGSRSPCGVISPRGDDGPPNRDDIEFSDGGDAHQATAAEGRQAACAGGAEDREEPADAGAPVRVFLEALKAHRTKQLRRRLKAEGRNGRKDSGLVFTTYRSPHRLRVRHRVDSMRVETRQPSGGPAVTTPGQTCRRPATVELLEQLAEGYPPQRSARASRPAGRRQAAAPRAVAHDLRHSAASLLIAEGVELVEVSMLLRGSADCA